MMQPRNRTAWLVAAATILLVAAMTFCVFLQIDRAKGAAYEQALRECASDRTKAVGRTLEDISGRMESLCRFYAGSSSVERDEFAMFEAPRPGEKLPIALTAWIPCVTRDERSTYETRAREEGLSAFQCTERMADGSLATAQDRDAYCPIYFAAPSSPIWAGFGMDLMTDPVCREAMARARDTGVPAATPLIDADRIVLHENGILVFAPVYNSFPPPDSVQQRQNTLKGYYLAACPVRTIVEVALGQFQSADLACDLEDTSDASGSRILYRHIPASSKNSLGSPDDPVHATAFEMGGRTWRLHFHPTKTFLARHCTLTHWWVLPIGMVAATCLAVAIYLLIAGRASAEAKVRLRTAELREEKERLAESESRLQLYFEYMPVACIVWDAAGRIQRWNPAAERLFGYSAGEVVGKAAADLLLSNRGADIKPVDDLPREDHPSRPIEACMTRDGRMIWCEWTNTRLADAAGRPVGMISMIQDVTEQEILHRAQREARAAAEAAARAQGEFLANMSHEIRTPISAMLGYTDLLLEEECVPEQIAHLKVVKRNGEHLLKVVNDILDLARVEAGKVQLEQVVCSPTELLADVATLMRVAAEAKGLELKVDCSPAIPNRMLSDPVRFRQILVNLVGNAVKFTESGEVRVAVHVAEGDSPALVCEVSDTGIGMTASQSSGLFRPFRQADTSTSRKYGGSGLGLAISQKLAEALGGSLCLAGTIPGLGSRFRLTLPLVVPPAESAANMPGKQATAASQLECRILLAEDGPDNQRLISLLLRKAGAQVATADNGRQAVDAVFQAEADGAPFDLILMDMQMPILDGYGATMELRQRGWTKPVLALTANAMAHDRKKCLDAGCDDYASKPIDRASLIAKVVHWTGANNREDAAQPLRECGA